jgi:hypothetical protein
MSAPAGSASAVSLRVVAEEGGRRGSARCTRPMELGSGDGGGAGGGARAKWVA